MSGCGGEGSLIWTTRAGSRWSGIKAVAINSAPEPNRWAHYDASAWTCAWLTVRGRQMIAPREMLLRPEWRGQVQWHEHYEPRKRGHRCVSVTGGAPGSRSCQATGVPPYPQDGQLALSI